MKTLQARSFDGIPLALVPALALAMLPLVGSPSSWLTLTIAGLAMGLIIFVIASGLTLVFGLMDVLNFGHGLFIALGAFVATSVLAGMGVSIAAMGVAAAGHLPPVAGALFQEVIDLAVILNALRALRG